MPTPINYLSKTIRVQPGSPASVRLDGWKEIAAHFARGERTVKRWEAERGLPVRRVPGGGRATVYAIPAELDAWLESHRDAALNLVDMGHTPASGAPIDVANVPSPVSVVTTDTSSKNAANVESQAATPAVQIERVRPRRAARHYIVGIIVVCTLLIIYFLRGIPRPQTPLEPSPEAEIKLAEDLYLKGRFEWNERTPESLNRAVNFFNESLRHDPGSSASYSGLADCYVLLREYSLLPAAQAYSRAIAAAKKAIALDDNNSDAHRSLAFAEIWGDWNFRDGKREFMRAITLNPRNALAHLWFATAFEAPEWHVVTEREFERAQELDPNSAVTLANKSIWMFQSGKRREGLELARQVEQADEKFLAPHRYLAAMAWQLRDYPQFLIESAKTAALQHDALLDQATKAASAGFRTAGESGLLAELYRIQKQQFEAGKLAGTILARVSVRVGHRDEAIHLIQRDFERRSPEFLNVINDWELRQLSGDPRFQTLIAQLDYPAPPALEPAAQQVMAHF